MADMRFHPGEAREIPDPDAEMERLAQARRILAASVGRVGKGDVIAVRREGETDVTVRVSHVRDGGHGQLMIFTGPLEGVAYE